MKKLWISMIALVALAMGSQAVTLTSTGVVTLDSATNWNPSQVPSSGNDTLSIGHNLIIDSTWTIGSGQSMTRTGGNWRFAEGGHLTVASNGTLTADGIYESGATATRSLTIEAGATATTRRYISGNGTVTGGDSGWTTKWIADASGVTTFNITADYRIRGGSIEVDLSSYDISNGTTLILADYETLYDGPYYAVTLTSGWSADVDMAYDQGGGDLAVALINISDAPVTNVPVITLLGDNPMEVELGTAFVDPGATATDVEDGDVSTSIVVSGTVDNNTVGAYTLDYDVSDSEGNPAETVTRTVNVFEVYTFWENDMTTDPIGDGWVYRDENTGSTVSGGLLTMTADGTRIDTTTSDDPWEGITKVDLEWRSTTIIDPDAPSLAKGAVLWLNVGGDAPDYGAINFSSALISNNTQTVTIYDGNTLVATLPGFGPGMLDLHADINAVTRTITYELTDGTITNSDTVVYPPRSTTGTLGMATLLSFNGTAEFDYVRIEPNVLPDETYVVAPDEIEMPLYLPATTVTGSVDVVYGSATNVVLSIALSDESNPGAFSVLTATPQTLDPVSASNLLLEVEFDNTVANLTDGLTATGLVTISWSDVDSAVVNDIVIPISVLASVPPVFWDDGAADDFWDSAANWVGDVAPVNGDSVELGAVGDIRLTTAFTIQNGQSLTDTGSGVNPELILEGESAVLTLATGGTMDISFLRPRFIAGSEFIIEPGASLDTEEVGIASIGTAKFIADADGVTTWNNSGTFVAYGNSSRYWDLEVDLSNYDTANGSTLVLVDYEGGVGGTFSNVTLTAGWEGTIDYAYDQGGGDLAVALRLGGAFSQWAGDYGLVGDDALPEADLEPDGLDNLMEYALGGNPTNDDAAVVSPGFYIAEETGADWLYHVYNERSDDDALVFSVGATDNLVFTPADTNDVFFVGESAESGGFKSVTNRTEADTVNKFIQLKVEK